MKLVVNGKEQSTEAKTVQDLINELKLDQKVMATAVNMSVVKKENWDSFELKEGDKLEFLEFVGGG